MLLLLLRSAQKSRNTPTARYVHSSWRQHERRPARSLPSPLLYRQRLLNRPLASPLRSTHARSSSARTRRPTAPSAHSVTAPRRTLVPSILNPFSSHFYHFWRYFFITLLCLLLPFHYIRSTTVFYHTIQGMSMFPLLRPGISEADAALLSHDRDMVERYIRSEQQGAREGQDIAADKAKSKSSTPIHPQDHDQLLTVPPLLSASQRRPLLSRAFLQVSSLFGILFDPSAHDYRLADDPVSEGGDGRKSNIERGMVVVFRAPYEPERLAVKRVVGIEGDVVVPVGVRDGDWGVTGRERRKLLEAWHRGEEVGLSGRWVEGAVEDGEAGSTAGVLIPYGHIWVEGVNQDETFDSNDCGPISKSLVTGIGVRVWWPLGRSVLWRESWEEDCYGRVFRQARDGTLKMVERLDGTSKEAEKLLDVPEEWAIH